MPTLESKPILRPRGHTFSEACAACKDPLCEQGQPKATLRCALGGAAPCSLRPCVLLSEGVGGEPPPDSREPSGVCGKLSVPKGLQFILGVSGRHYFV